MAFLDIFKKKKEEPKPKKKPTAKKKPLAAKIPPPEKKPSVVLPKNKKISKIGYRVLLRPQITEKAGDLAERNQYVFKVFSEVNKTAVKKSVEDAYGVDVESVKIVNIHSKKKRLGRIEGRQSGYKKAIVKIKEGQKIEILPR